MLDLTLSHLAIVADRGDRLATIIAVGLAILVTRPFGAEFLPLSRSLANIGQTFPPVAVLALAVPVLGFGTAPTLVALFLYGLLPIFENALTGLTDASADGARGGARHGHDRAQRLVRVELPLALPVILGGHPAFGGHLAGNRHHRLDGGGAHAGRGHHRRALVQQHRVRPAGRAGRGRAGGADL